MNLTHDLGINQYMFFIIKLIYKKVQQQLRYINGFVNVGLSYKKRYNTFDLVGYVDSDFTGEKDTQKSTTALFFTLGGNCIN